ncbi:hypothetical protein Gohar_007240, partial [Gossypium harknessii]|nr:hypothetical protein [Gossypium harknessii]
IRVSASRYEGANPSSCVTDFRTCFLRFHRPKLFSSNEKLVVLILEIGVSLGINNSTMFGDEKSGFMLKKQDVKNATAQMMTEGTKRRERAKEFGEQAKKSG